MVNLARSQRIDISEESLRNIRKRMRTGTSRYWLDELDENGFFYKAFKNYPKNDSPEIVAMKISLVDTTNSTNLSRILGDKRYKMYDKVIERKVFTFSELVQKILEIDFDRRVEAGDITLVSELTKWGKDWGTEKDGANIMSFFSKYCLYHNNISYNKDDYSIFDSVVQNNLGNYLSEQEFRKLFPNTKLRKSSNAEELHKNIARAVSLEIGKMKNNCDYESYHRLIGDILGMKNILINGMRRNLDYLVWYDNR